MTSALQARAATLGRLSSEPFDVLVIGGGITGVGIARDAALRGLKVALVEKSDFASGTSSKSSKLVHGGFRYLEHAQFRLVFEGTNERALLMKVAPHLVRPLEFLLPVYKADKPGLFVLDVGLWIYDGMSKFSSPKLHRTVRAGRLAKLEPGLKLDALEGGLLYYDCATDDARLTLENVIDARALGAAVVNYTRAVRLIKEGDRIAGAEVQAIEGRGDGDGKGEGATLPIRARVTINATGPWCDEIRQMAGDAGILHTSKGVHLVVDAARLNPRHAVVMKQKKRIVFCIPWGGDRTVIGTTDTFYDGKPEDVHTDKKDVDYLLALANNYFPEAKLKPEDVLATWAGLRPLLKPDSDTETASDVSREHAIVERPGLVTIAGGKLTTYRRMAAEVVDHAGKQLGEIAASRTADRPLPGAAGAVYEAGYAGVTKLQEELAAEGSVDGAVAKQLASTYGARAPSVVARVKADVSAGRRLDPELPYIEAQVDVAVDEEQALSVEDVLGRRVQLILRARDQGLGCVERVAKRMAPKLGWDDARTKAEIEHYRGVVART
ncbi:MAG TPA: glycerol-3-phosphate dehydrogenase, partial [Polyangia bacterium]|nr:glycerol-3-phosphate dehydrogenase [Polyangia bacterium]